MTLEVKRRGLVLVPCVCGGPARTHSEATKAAHSEAASCLIQAFSVSSDRSPEASEKIKRK